MMPSFNEALRVWLRIGLLSFGGPAGQIALIHREVLDERKWIEEQEFLNALNFCMLLPGPEAMQLATYIGWKLHGVRGGLVAGLLFVLPGAFVILALSILYAIFGKLHFIEGLFWGVKAAVLVIVLQALLRVAKKALKGWIDWALAAGSFLALFVFGLPFPLVVAVAAVVGILFPKVKMDVSSVLPSYPEWRGTLKTIAIWLLIWFVPLGLFYGTVGAGHVYSDLALFFSQLAVVTFGGAYAVLSYMGQDVVELHHWLTTPEMMDGLGLAETTPGPLILVGQFVGFLAAHHAFGTVWAGVIGSLIFLWMTFVPCFLWIFAGAPYVVHLQNMPRVASALSRITSAVVGVILNLAMWFGLHVLFSGVVRLEGPVPVWWPEFKSFDRASLVLSIIAGIALLHYKIGILKTLAIAAALGVIWKLMVPLIWGF
jgi:chromate transporter